MDSLSDSQILMTDWVDSFTELLGDLAQSLCHGRTRRQAISLLCACFSAFVFIGTSIALLSGQELAAFGWWIAAPAFLVSLAMSIRYAFFVDD